MPASADLPSSSLQPLLEACHTHINDIIIITEAEPIDEPGPRIVYVNDAFVKRTGYTRDFALGRSPRFLQGPNTDRETLDALRSAMLQWQAYRCELLNYTKDGEEFWIELDIVPIVDGSGWYTHWVAIERDITERKQAEAAVAASEQLAQATLDALPAPVCVLDGDGVIRATNLAWREYSRVNDGDTAGTGVGVNYLAVCETFTAVLPHEQRQQSLVPKLRAILAGELDAFELQYPCHSMTEARWYEARFTRFQGPGPRRVAVVHLDVTTFKQAELREATQARVMSLLANDAPQDIVLEAIALGVQAENPTLLCAVHLIDPASGRLKLVAAPSLPAFYAAAIGDVVPGPQVGSCGTAAWRGERVISGDIASDPLWAAYAEVALRAGLRACWSEPLRDGAGRLLGTFALYHRQPRTPGEKDFRLIAAAARFAAVAIERKHDEDALQESEARFANAFEFAAVGIALRALDGRWLKINRAFCDMLGYDEDALLGHDLETLTHADDLPRLRWNLARIATGESDSFQQELRFVHRHARTLWVLLSISTVRAANGEAIYNVCQVQDVTALKMAENERDMLFDLSPDMLCVAYIDGRFKQVNPAWQRTLGWRADELLTASYTELVHPDDLNATLLAGQALREGRAVLEFENRYRCRDGSYRVLSWNSFPLPEVGVTFAVVRDVTERAAAQAEQRAADRRAGERQRLEALGSLAGGIAHDFNNMLAVMLGNATLARRAGNAELMREKIAQIEIAGQRAVDLVQQILTFSRRQPQQLKLLALGEIVRETMHLLRATIPAGIAIDLRIEDALPPIVADATQLHQIVMNLCTNAWHALQGSARPDPRIDVDVFVGDDDVATTLGGTPRRTRCVSLSVRDNGVGMDAATRARIFEPFFTTREVGEGTGLGLSVVHGIVAAHDGSIQVDSAPGVGTTIRVNFPVASESALEASLSGTLDEDAAGAGATPDTGQHVLYVDDEPQLVALASELLELDGYRVSGHTDAASALAALRAAPQGYDLVITDFNMPKCSGFDIARELQTLRPSLPVVVASGNITPAMRIEAQAIGVRALLNKTDIASNLRAIVREVLAGN